MADYRSTLTGTQMDSALLDMAEHNSEAYAVGERNGIAVASDDVTYHNNARYYAQIASSQIVGDASSAVRWDTDQSEALTSAQKAVARNNIGAASDSDVVKITSQTLTSSEQAQARANIMAGGSNPNLLDNPFFTVNQRSFTSSTETNGVRCVDRWYINNGGGTVTKTSNGMLLDNTSGTRYLTFQETFGSDEAANRTVTVSVKDGETIYSRTITVPARTSSTQMPLNYAFAAGREMRLYVSPALATGSYLLQIYCAVGYSIDLRAVKLELGSVSTLANDTPPDYGTELLKCQRYFVRLKKLYSIVGIGYALNATTPWFFAPTPVPLRDGVALTSAISGLYVAAPSGFHAVSAIAIQNSGTAYSASGVFFNATTTGLSSGEVCVLQVRDASGYLDFSADL